MNCWQNWLWKYHREMESLGTELFDRARTKVNLWSLGNKAFWERKV